MLLFVICLQIYDNDKELFVNWFSTPTYLYLSLVIYSNKLFNNFFVFE